MSDTQHPVAIVVSDRAKGLVYAEALDIKNYVLVTDLKDVEGLFTRGVIVSPGYIEEALMKLDSGLSVFYAANRVSFHNNHQKG